MLPTSNWGRRCLVTCMLAISAAFFGGRFAIPLGVLLLVKEFSNSLDSTMKCCLGPCGCLLWCLEDTVQILTILGTCAVFYAALLWYQGRVPDPITVDATAPDMRSSEAAEIGIVWLHGLGDSARRCSGISRMLTLPVLTEWHFPSASVRQVSIDWGLPRRAWFDITVSPVRYGMSEDEEGISESIATVHAAIDALEASGIRPHRILVGGLSQGGAVALAGAFTYPKRLAGVAVLSGWLPECISLRADTEKEEGKSGTTEQKSGTQSHAHQRCPVYWQHGLLDDAVLPEMQEEGVRRLQASGVRVTSVRDADAGHMPGPAQLAGLDKWLHQIFRVGPQ